MSVNHTPLTKLALLFAMIGALALAGCSSDDGSGISQDMYDALQAEADTASAAAAAARAAQAEAEADEAAAHAAQMAAEADKMAAEADAAEAMAAQMEAEADKMAAEAAKDAAEAARVVAVAAQAVAESEASQAKADKAKAEADLKAAQMDAKDDLDAAKMEAKEAADKAAADLKDANDALAAAKQAETDAKIALATAQSDAKAAETAKMEAMDAKDKAEMARDEAIEARDMAKQAEMDAKDMLAKAEEDRDKYKMMYEDATDTDVDTVGTTVGAAARAVAARIVGAIAPGTMARNANTDAMTPAVMRKYRTIREDISLKNLKRTADGLSFMVDETTTRLTEADMADDMAPSLAGLQGVALSKTGGGVMQEALIYTDIDRSVTAFSAKYPYTHNNIADDALFVTTPPAGSSNTHIAVASVADTADPDTGEVTMRTFDSNSKVAIEHGLSSSLDMRILAAGAGIRGKYDGVPGQYMCGSAGDVVCQLDYDGSGARPRLTFQGRTSVAVAGAADAALYFRADDPSELLPDPDYLAYGVWMVEPSTATATGGFIRPFVSAGAVKFTQEQMHSLKGKADYMGAATGYYATRNAKSADANAGRFTATATLKANFDTSSESSFTRLDSLKRAQTALVGPGGENPTTYYRPKPGSPGSITGTINNFMAEDGTMMEGWVVNLGAATMMEQPADKELDVAGTAEPTLVTEAENAAKAVTMLEGMTTGTGHLMEWEGVWDATLHGNTKTTAPTGVVGRFQAQAGMPTPPTNDDGAINLLGNDIGFAGVVGSFGARKQP